MSLDWRKFAFFSSASSVPLSAVDPLEFALSSAKGILFIGERTGSINLLNANYQSNLYRAHEGQVFQLWASPSKDIFISVGIDDSQPTLKVWTYDEKFAEYAQTPPKCVHCRMLSSQDFLGDVSALAVNSALTQAAIGFTGGKVLLLKGDILREKHSKISQLHSSAYPVTNLEFDGNRLYVITVKDCQFYEMHEKNPGRKHLDEKGCAPNCACISASGELIIGRSEDVYSYDRETKRVTSHPISGEKFQIIAFGRYQVVLTKDNSSSAEKKLFRVTIFSLHDRLSVFTSVFTDVHAICCEWTSICILSGAEELELTRLFECDVDQKLDTLFQRNHFDIAKSICHEQGFGESGLADVNKRWADFLFEKGDLMQAAEKYVDTLGKLEPSYVLHKLMDAQRLPPLTFYLEALVSYNSEHGIVTGATEHRSLLISCYAKEKDEKNLKRLLELDSLPSSDALENAMGVLLQSGLTEAALSFAKASKNHSLVMMILTEKKSDPMDALNYVISLSLDEKLTLFRKYGPYFVKYCSKAFLTALKEIASADDIVIESPCEESAPRRVQFIDGDESESDSTKLNIQHLLDILEGNSSLSLEFTEYCLSMRKCQGLKFLSQRFMEMQLRRLTTSSDEVEISRLEQSILSLIENKKLEYKQALVYCRQFNFTAGLVKLLSAGPGGDLTDLLSVLLESSQNEEALQLCKKNGRENTGLWRKAILYWSSRSNYDGVQKILAEAIPAASDCIDLSALINMLKSSSAPIAILKPLILKKLEQDDVDIKKCESRILKLTTSIDKQKEKRKNLLQQASIFKLSKCKLCGKDLSLPSVHFLCGHSFHHHCFTTYIDQDGECPICAQQNRQVLQALKLPEQSRVSEEKFLGQVGKSSDSFGTIIEMLARGEIITHRKKSERSSENFETEPKPVSNKLLANRARIATELKFGLTPETPKSFSGKSPKTNAVIAILEVPPEEKPFDIQLSRPAIQPAENPFGESIDNASDSELNPFGDANEDEEEIKITKDFKFSNPFGESTAELTGNPFGEDESDSPGEANPFGDDDSPDTGNPFGDDDDSTENDANNPFN